MDEHMERNFWTGGDARKLIEQARMESKINK
jgi:hypothetical protein